MRLQLDADMASATLEDSTIGHSALERTRSIEQEASHELS